MKIIAGTAKGRLLKTRKGTDTRPTLDRVKESLFAILDPYLSESRFLDLFSGSGSIGLEALSRGAKKCVMIEKDNEALKYIIENINNLDFADKCRAYKNESIRAIEILGKKREKFDIIFMDPPYKDEVCTSVMNAIIKADILEKNGLVICEHHIAENLPMELEGLKKVDERNYRKKIITFYTGV